MSDQPDVSIVIPTCSRKDILGLCLAALARQTHGEFEVIVVDDESTDGTPEMLETFARDHSDFPFRWFRNEPRRGANPSRNRGIQESKGEFVAFLDDDCVPADDWLERLMTGFVSDRVAAVTGRVDNAPPSNVYELTLKGTQRVHGKVHASRLVGCNMCIRRDLLLRYGFDEDRASAQKDASVSGRGDEEGLFLTLRAAGYEQRVIHDAAVEHHHPHSRRTFFRQAYRGGTSTARLAYKYYLPPRIDLVPLMMAYVSLPLAWAWPTLWPAPVIFAAFFLMTILYNDYARKRKAIWEILVTLPLLLIYYHLRLIGYVVQWARLWTGRDRIARVRLQPEAPGGNTRP